MKPKPCLIWYGGVGHWCDPTGPPEANAWISRVDGSLFIPPSMRWSK